MVVVRARVGDAAALADDLDRYLAGEDPLALGRRRADGTPAVWLAMKMAVPGTRVAEFLAVIYLSQCRFADLGMFWAPILARCNVWYAIL